MLQKASDPNAKFGTPDPSCPTCGGSTWATTYKNGLPYAVRCPGFVFVKMDKPEESYYYCNGNPHHEQFDRDNRESLCSVIWHTLIRAEADETKFLSWLKKEYLTDKLDALNVKQLEAVLLKAKAKLDAKIEEGVLV